MNKIILTYLLLCGCAHQAILTKSAPTEIMRQPALAGSSSLYPDPAKTPGVVRRATTESDVCTTGFTSTIRNVSGGTKNEVFISYLGAVPNNPNDYEIDHFISLELGGANDIRNLWPQPYAPLPGARQKDVVETYLKHEVCAKRFTLDQVQRIISMDWYACYQSMQQKQPCAVPAGNPIFVTVDQ